MEDFSMPIRIFAHFTCYFLANFLLFWLKLQKNGKFEVQIIYEQFGYRHSTPLFFKGIFIKAEYWGFLSLSSGSCDRRARLLSYIIVLLWSWHPLFCYSGIFLFLCTDGSPLGLPSNILCFRWYMGSCTHSNVYMWVFSTLTSNSWGINWVSWNSTQFWYYLPRDSIRLHRLRVHSCQMDLVLPTHFQTPVTMLRNTDCKLEVPMNASLDFKCQSQVTRYFWPSAYKSGSLPSSFGSINLLEWTTELRNILPARSPVYYKRL